MKPSELRDKTDDELRELETELRDKLIKLQVARATQRAANTAQFVVFKKDIARIKTILHERTLGLAGSGSADADAAKEATA
ncbi:MAG: 50S ribosomal protein L29 [Deltaproteobacteria bacterium]|nr:50S ribosomal protein L29 [Deltaproteobacteria bacterium]